MGGREHLPRHAKGHGHTSQIQIARCHSCHNGHNNGHMPLAHARQHADNEADAGDNHRHRQGRALEGYNNLLQHVGNGEDLDKV